uniref:Uncharacterized protein n=1 Tax=Arundo donax TaxID=35708 RepID=A0A0A8Z9D6_ARUDO
MCNDIMIPSIPSPPPLLLYTTICKT